MTRAKSQVRTVAREYLRVSRDTSGEGKSTDQQHDDNIAAIDAEGWTAHPDPYRDDDRSASRYARKEREDFKRLIADLEEDRFGAQILVIWESSRGSRRVGEWVDLIELCQERGVRIFVTTHHRTYNPENARDRRTLLEDAVDAAYESDKNRERIQRDAAAAAREGRVHGKNLYGYTRTYRQTPSGPKIDEVLEHPEQAAVVRDAAERVLKGESYYSIAKRFNAQGIPPRREATSKTRKDHGWTGSAIRQMLSVPAYAGKRVHRGEIVADAVWPALIEPADWDALQAILFQPGRRKNPNSWTVRYLCTGVAVCGVCGSRLVVGKQNRGRMDKEERARLCVCREGPDADGVQGADRCPSHYRTYVCSGLPGVVGKSGFHTAIKVEHLDEIVTEMILARLERPDFLATINERRDGTDARRQELLEAIGSDQAYLESVAEQAADMRDLSLLITQRDLVQPRIDAAQKELESLARVDPAVTALLDSGSVREAWERLDVVGKRRIIAAIAVPQVNRVGRGWAGRKGPNPERVGPGWR